MSNTMKCKGQVLILTAVVIVVLIGVVGLAVDSGIGYLIKAKLNAAVDAAGIAAARSVSQGLTQADQAANGKVAAKKFFDANYPTGYFSSVPVWTEPTVTFSQGKVIIDVAARATVPITFMGIFGFKVLDVAASAQAIRKDLDMAFVVDTTGSMSGVAAQVRSAAKTFLGYFNTTAERVALIHFSSGAVVDVPFKSNQSRGFDRTSMNTVINGYNFTGYTNYAEGFWNARDQLNRVINVANRSSLRVVVFFSDGAPNTAASYFTFKTASACSSPGAIATGEGATGSISGLYNINSQYQQLPGNCWRSDLIPSSSTNYLTTTALPQWYNAHNKLDREFQFAPNPAGLRNVTNNTSTSNLAYRNINRASRNLAEEMASKSRQEGIYVFTLGLGSNLRTGTGPDNEQGEDLLKCMANTPDSLTRCYKPSEPVGVYCWARTANDLGPCFARLASEVLRLTK